MRRAQFRQLPSYQLFSTASWNTKSGRRREEAATKRRAPKKRWMKLECGRMKSRLGGGGLVSQWLAGWAIDREVKGSNHTSYELSHRSL